jgi:hypothetical protein
MGEIDMCIGLSTYARFINILVCVHMVVFV